MEIPPVDPGSNRKLQPLGSCCTPFLQSVVAAPRASSGAPVLRLSSLGFAFDSASDSDSFLLFRYFVLFGRPSVHCFGTLSLLPFREGDLDLSTPRGAGSFSDLAPVGVPRALIAGEAHAAPRAIRLFIHSSECLHSSLLHRAPTPLYPKKGFQHSKIFSIFLKLSPEYYSPLHEVLS